MDVAIFIAVWLLVGIGVIFVAFSGGPSRARAAYLTGGRRFFTFLMLLIYVGLGVAVPALIIANREEALGATSDLRGKDAGKLSKGKHLFASTCATCHTLAAANARGVTGPDLDRIGPVNQARVLGAIKNGGTGQGRMPAGLLQGSNAQAVAAYVSKVASGSTPGG
ncbi:MAG: c-type cytochrome [Thermoleophilaceae bacterium]